MRMIMVVEDEPVVRMMASKVLEPAEHIAVDFMTADQALAYCTEPINPVDALLAHVNTPGELDGFHLARQVVAARPELRIVLTSGRNATLPDDMPASVRFLAKPWTLDAVLGAIR